ncbi:type I-E CRISPR-associated protein Cas6/Cse3/CasE [Paratractidigestivibacter sp.]|uniref:type I-E CRISPR-associated protein Cas6/Cse3/CasE n=1 Tax=Paratractidigestivibacter sp. TaxID=2847316 RepID=UPI002ACB0E31|nr:type I-E CRISPR-associated protein Cas6/Cse3/CasE [Paratractidigestivibacter sp.]
MMYITRMALNGARRSAMEIIASPNKMHAAVEASFPPLAASNISGTDQDRGECGRTLWRIDPIPGEGRNAWLYVVSPRRPDFTHLCEQAGWPVEGSWETKDYDRLLGSLDCGQLWQFRLKANPVRKVFEDKGSRSDSSLVGTLQGHVTVQQQMKWLLDRSDAHGFRVCMGSDGQPQATVSQRSKVTFGHSGSKVTLVTAVFDGALKIVDPGAFRKALCCGVGRAKAFGCGLMTIAPLSQVLQEEA